MLASSKPQAVCLVSLLDPDDPFQLALRTRVPLVASDGLPKLEERSSVPLMGAPPDAVAPRMMGAPPDAVAPPSSANWRWNELRPPPSSVSPWELERLGEAGPSSAPPPSEGPSSQPESLPLVHLGSFGLGAYYTGCSVPPPQPGQILPIHEYVAGRDADDGADPRPRPTGRPSPAKPTLGAALARADVVLARYTPGLFAELQRIKRGLIVVFVGPTKSKDELLEASRGAPFEHMHSEAEFVAFLDTLLRPRLRPPRRRARAHRLVVPADDPPPFSERAPLSESRPTSVGAGRGSLEGTFGTAHSIAELSQEEVSFYVETGDDMERFLVGSILEPSSIVVARDGTVAAVDLCLYVRTVYLDAGRYRVTAAFGRRRGEASPPPWQRRVQGWRCQALIQGAIARGEVFSIEADGVTVTVTADQIDSTDDGIRFAPEQALLAARGSVFPRALDEKSPRFAAFEPVAVSFRARECHCSFSSVVVDAGDATKKVMLRAPAEILEIDARRTVRHDTSRLPEAEAELTTPLFAEVVRGRVTDFGANGFRVRWLLPPGLPMPLGTVFDRVTIRLSGAILRGRAVLRNLADDDEGRASLPPGEDMERGILLGFSFEPDLASSGQLPSLFARLEVPGIVDGSTATFDNLIQLFRSSNFLSVEMENRIRPLMAESARTFEILRRAPRELFHSAAFYGNQEHLAYISLVRGYRRTLVMQHLAALPGRGFGKRVQSGILQYLDGQSDYEYIRIFFFLGNAFPESRFGDFARKDHDPNAVDLRLFSHVMIPAGTTLPGPPVTPGVEAHLATDEELMTVERYLLATERGLLIRSEDLGTRWMRLDAIHEQFEALGLERRRLVFLVTVNGAPVAASFLEWSSPGINLFEGFSTFRLFLFEDTTSPSTRPYVDAAEETLFARRSQETREAATRALLQAMLTQVESHGRPFLFGLVAPPLVESLRTLSAFSDHKSWSFTVRRDHLRLFQSHLQI